MQFIEGKCEVMRPGTKTNQTPVGARAVWNTDQSTATRARAGLGKSRRRWVAVWMVLSSAQLYRCTHCGAERRLLLLKRFLFGIVSP